MEPFVILVFVSLADGSQLSHCSVLVELLRLIHLYLVKLINLHAKILARKFLDVDINAH